MKVQVNWLFVFDEIDISSTAEIAAHVTDSLSQKEEFFKSGNYKLTVKYLFEFKKATYLLPIESKVAYIDGLDLKPPKPFKTAHSHLDQTVFEAQLNFYEFIVSYRVNLLAIMNPIKRYVLHQLHLQELLQHSNFKAYKEQIERLGYFGMSTNTYRSKVYTAELCAIIGTEKLTMIDQASGEETTVKGTDYIEPYVNGFKEGVEYFDAKFAAPPAILYGENSVNYISDLHSNYYHNSTENAPD